MQLLSVTGLCKKYEKFELKDVSFSLESGYIMGFIGRNGAGKTTTLKSMLNIVHPDAGEVRMFGLDFAHDEMSIKQEIGVVFGGADYYDRKKLRAVASVVKRFYTGWDDGRYRDYLDRFELDENKRINELSAGMRVKFSLALALSHNAKLLILDEPTSGLDPVSRDDLLELFRELIEDGTRSILFSTHITSDLDKCADFITYIKDGRIFASTDRETLLDSYVTVKGDVGRLTKDVEQRLIGVRRYSCGFEALALRQDEGMFSGFELARPDLETVMVHIEKE